jgi:putative endonuclease
MREAKSYCAYMVADRSRVLYVGFTSNLYQRVMQHRSGHFEGFTSRYHCDRLVTIVWGQLEENAARHLKEEHIYPKWCHPDRSEAPGSVFLTTTGK